MVFMTFYDDLNFFFLKYSDAVESEKLLFLTFGLSGSVSLKWIVRAPVGLLSNKMGGGGTVLLHDTVP